MKLKKFLEIYDDWNEPVYINDDNLNRIAEDKPEVIYHNDELSKRKVVAFGFYDNCLFIRVK